MGCKWCVCFTGGFSALDGGLPDNGEMIRSAYGRQDGHVFDRTDAD